MGLPLQGCSLLKGGTPYIHSTLVPSGCMAILMAMDFDKRKAWPQEIC